MNLKNTTDFPAHFLRRMISWTCRQLGLPVRQVHQAQFTHCDSMWSGLAWPSGRILIRISRPGLPYDGSYPITRRYSGLTRAPEYTIADRMEALVKVTAHEMAHLLTWYERAHNGEAAIDTMALQVLAAFRADREALLTHWNEAPARSVADRPQLSVVERRHAKAAADLARWQRKLKLAKTKVAKLLARVRYYEKKNPVEAEN